MKHVDINRQLFMERRNYTLAANKKKNKRIYLNKGHDHKTSAMLKYYWGIRKSWGCSNIRKTMAYFFWKTICIDRI